MSEHRVKQIAVVFHSVGGTTAKLAHAINEGANSVSGASSQLLEIKGSDIHQGRYRNDQLMHALGTVEAIVFGAPTYMGSVSGQFKAFADASSESWSNSGWTNKIAAGFTIGGSLSGDQLSTIQYLQIFACQHGMLWVGLDIRGNETGQEGTLINRLGAHSGLITHSKGGALNPYDIHTAFYLGQRVAGLALAFR